MTYAQRAFLLIGVALVAFWVCIGGALYWLLSGA